MICSQNFSGKKKHTLKPFVSRRLFNAKGRQIKYAYSSYDQVLSRQYHIQLGHPNQANNPVKYLGKAISNTKVKFLLLNDTKVHKKKGVHMCVVMV